MFDQLKNLGSLMKNAAAMREKAEQMRAELEKKTVTGEAGGGAVRVILTGQARCVSIEIDKNLMIGIAGDDKAVAEDLITAAFNDAQVKVHELLAEHVSEITGGMDLGGLQGMMGLGD
ncbi:MAG: YbaB/EbfC family nucleoid-associated protein [Phycisphaera sp.]|nr:YbaB/EbfC family nucleoid-associated protein [Phycisphaera sp.]